MAYTKEEIHKAFDVAIASNSRDAMLWVASHPFATAKHLEAIASKGKKIPLTLKCIVARHDNLDHKSCEHFRESNSLELACAIISNRSLDTEYRKSWLTRKVIREAMRAFEHTSKSNKKYQDFYDKHYWSKKLESFKVKLPEDVWPEFDNLMTVRDIIT